MEGASYMKLRDRTCGKVDIYKGIFGSGRFFVVFRR